MPLFIDPLTDGYFGGDMKESTGRTLELNGNTVEISESGASVVLDILCPSFQCMPARKIRIAGKENLLKLCDAIDAVLAEPPGAGGR